MKPSETIMISTKQVNFWQKEISRLQEQLNEANEIISDLSEYPPINPSTRELSNALNRYNAKEYLKKWGVK